MKRKLYSLMLVMSALFSLTSCMDDDTHRSMYLSGEWQGDFGMFYTYVYRGREYRFDCYDTDIEFIPEYEYATYGYGYQVDWYREGPYRYLSYRFLWEIRNGVISMHYPGNEEWDTDIYNYSLNDDYFSGRFDGSSSRFNLVKIRGYYDWSPYYGRDFGYDYRTGYDYYPFSYYYSPTRSTDDDDVDEAIVIHRGNRFTGNE